MRRKKIGGCIALACTYALVLWNCGKTEPPSIRAAFEAEWGSPLTMKVYLEGEDGKSVDAASVSVSDPAGSALHLDYDGTKAAYIGSIYGPIGGTYHIAANSRAGSASLDLPVTILSVQPSITAITDASGNSASLGQALAGSSGIGIAWDTSTGASVYILRISKAGAHVLSRSVTDPFVEIAASSIAAGSYSASVEAQAVFGDPLLAQQAFYSASSARSASFSFDIQ